MPIITPEQEPTPQRRRGPWLLLPIPPAVGLLFLDGITLRPHHPGPLVVTSISGKASDAGCYLQGRKAYASSRRQPFHEGGYEVQGESGYLTLHLRDWNYEGDAFQAGGAPDPGQLRAGSRDRRPVITAAPAGASARRMPGCRGA